MPIQCLTFGDISPRSYLITIDVVDFDIAVFVVIQNVDEGNSVRALVVVLELSALNCKPRLEELYQAVVVSEAWDGISDDFEVLSEIFLELNNDFFEWTSIEVR